MEDQVVDKMGDKVGDTREILGRQVGDHNRDTIGREWGDNSEDKWETSGRHKKTM